MKDLINQRFNKLLVTKRIASNRNKSVTWECVCDCGNICVFSTNHLTRKKQAVKSCGCLRFLNGNSHKDFKGYGEISASWWQSRITRTYPKKKKIEVTITIKEAWELFLKQERKCALSGLTLSFSNRNPLNTASLDRIDSEKGYSLDNVQWVHKHINRMKNTYSQEYFIDMCYSVVNTMDDRLLDQANELLKKRGW